MSTQAGQIAPCDLLVSELQIGLIVLVAWQNCRRNRSHIADYRTGWIRLDLAAAIVDKQVGRTECRFKRPPRAIDPI